MSRARKDDKNHTIRKLNHRMAITIGVGLPFFNSPRTSHEIKLDDISFNRLNEKYLKKKREVLWRTRKFPFP